MPVVIEIRSGSVTTFVTTSFKLLNLEIISKLQKSCNKNSIKTTYYYPYSSFAYALSLSIFLFFSKSFENKLYNLWLITSKYLGVYFIRIGVFFYMTRVQLSTSVNLIHNFMRLCIKFNYHMCILILSIDSMISFLALSPLLYKIQSRIRYVFKVCI